MDLKIFTPQINKIYFFVCFFLYMNTLKYVKDNTVTVGLWLEEIKRKLCLFHEFALPHLTSLILSFFSLSVSKR